MHRTALASTAVVLTACAGRRAPATPLGARLSPASAAWVDGTLARLDLRHKVAQLVIPRVSGSFMAVGSAEYERVRHWIQDLGIGGLIETLGPPAEAAVKLNMLQRLADIPLLVSADMEEGPGQLLNGGIVLPYGFRNGGGTRFPPAMALGATGDERLAREAGRITAIEARAVGVHVNFAPVVDVNNNPANPIINVRSFGADPDLVSRLAAAMIGGMQDHGVLATAKHFPGHGDTDVDSHVNLPVITATRARADSVELPPYRAAVESGVAGVMSAHIAFPGISGDLEPATLSAPILSGLLRDSLGFRGLVFTDALDMGAIVQRYGAAEAPVRALEAGADLLLQVRPDDVPAAIDAIVEAVRQGRISESRIDTSVRRLLEAKAALGLDRQRFVDLERLPFLVGTPEHEAVAREAAERSITIARDREALLPIRRGRTLAILYNEETDPFAGRPFLDALGDRIEEIDVERLTGDAAAARLDQLRQRAAEAELVVFAPFVRVGAARGPLSVAPEVGALVREIAAQRNVIVVSFGSPYVLGAFPDIPTYLLAWGQSDALQVAAARALTGRIRVSGRLPISIPPFHQIGEGISVDTATPAGPAVNPLARARRAAPLATAEPDEVGMEITLAQQLDSIMESALAQGAAPGGVLGVGRMGRIVHLRGYGRLGFADSADAASDSAIYDVASLTKVVATTTAMMILVDEGRIDLDSPVSRYLPEWRPEGDRARVTVRNLLAHNSGLPAFANLWRELRGRTAYLERIAATPLEHPPGDVTVYSDFGAILLGFMVERITGQTLDRFVEDRVFRPLGMRETGFEPLRWREGAGGDVRPRIAFTEVDTVFRMKHVRGRVHDENAFAMGGVAGHAGLFSSARDLAVFAQMLLSGGVHDGVRIVSSSTLAEFTRRQSEASSRALGWDTPSEGSSAGDHFSPSSFGHTGFTGTSLWIDPEQELFIVLLTNRVDPTRDNQRHVRLRRDVSNAVQRAANGLSRENR